MYTVLVVATRGDPHTGLLQALEKEGVSYTIVPRIDGLPNDRDDIAVDAVLLDLSECDSGDLHSVVQRCQVWGVPLLCGLSPEDLNGYDFSCGARDFFLLPPSGGEVTARISQAHSEEREPSRDGVLQVGDLRIDLERYEVFSRGRRVLLTFKEYQLLCVLASRPGRVYSRETLLTQIWEYDYYGGTRTVDVHIRRLRSKIEDTGHTYIETIRNVGYRLHPQVLQAQEAGSSERRRMAREDVTHP